MNSLRAGRSRRPSRSPDIDISDVIVRPENFIQEGYKDMSFREGSVDLVGWTDWQWQQRNAIRSSAHIRNYLPECPQDILDLVDRHIESRRFQITPYYLSLIRIDPDQGGPAADDPLWLQVAPRSMSEDAPYGYDGETENWELPAEMVTPIAQRKYDNRIIVRYANTCHSYCQFCYEALRTLDKDSVKASFDRAYWAETLDYLRVSPQIEEVILSGGEPLMHSNDQLDRALCDLREARPDLVLRIHTRALTFNPYRIDEGLVDVMRRRGVQAIGLHVTHPRELSEDFVRAVTQLQSAVPILFANVPLLAGVNDTPEIMRDLCMNLYRTGVHAGYLYHFMPHSPAAGHFRVPIERGVEIMMALRRHISSPAVPEYVLPHATGKYTVSLLQSPDDLPRYETDSSGVRMLSIVNWQGQRVQYPDPA
jgi:lysine 2,3-aminomutase